VTAEHMGISAEHTRTELRFNGDERLLAGVRGAIEHIGRRHDVADEERIDAAVAAEQACRKAILQMEDDSLCVVTIDDFEDRVEVSVESPRCSGHARRNSPAENVMALQPDEREAEIKKRVDRADFEASNGRARTTLVKYFYKKRTHS